MDRSLSEDPALKISTAVAVKEEWDLANERRNRSPTIEAKVALEEVKGEEKETQLAAVHFGQTQERKIR